MLILTVNLTLTLAMLAGSLFIRKEVWTLLFAAISILIILVLYMIKERENIRQGQAIMTVFFDQS
jgi:predicted branched-subunit amino acid permease